MKKCCVCRDEVKDDEVYTFESGYPHVLCKECKKIITDFQEGNKYISVDEIIINFKLYCMAMGGLMYDMEQDKN